MITRWRLFNFKSVKSDTNLDFGPLTLFAGPNSGGKSTCIQSVLLICQTLRNQIGSRSVILNGTLARLGQFSDLKSYGGDANQILIGWELRPASAGRLAAEAYVTWEEDSFPFDGEDGLLVSLACEVGFDAKTDSPNDTSQLNPQLFSTLIRTTRRDADGVDHLTQVSMSRTPDGGESELSRLRDLGLAEVELDRVRPTAAIRVDLDDESSHELKRRFVSGEAVGCELLHFLPSRIVLVFNSAVEHTQALMNAVFGTARVPPRLRTNLYIPVSGLSVLGRILGSSSGRLVETQADFDRLLLAEEPISLSSFQEALRSLTISRRRQVQEQLQSSPTFPEEFAAAVRTELADEYRTAFVLPSHGLQMSCQYMRRYFSQAIKYLGPLRDEPKALYPLANADPFDVGLQGENTAAVLDLHKSRLVRFVPPSAFGPPAVVAEPIVRTLQVAVSDWLRHLGVADSVESIDKGKLGHELKVRVDRHSGQQDLTHVGVGVSQVLPILVMCLLAERDSVLLFEQPELHLHPRVQTLLGDFFLSMALMDKQCIIETHSEYLISRLRFRAASATSDEVANRIKMYFVEKHDDSSKFRQVKVNQYGAIEDWPEGFFDQSQKEAEATLKAAMKKRRQAQQRKN